MESQQRHIRKIDVSGLRIRANGSICIANPGLAYMYFFAISGIAFMLRGGGIYKAVINGYGSFYGVSTSKGDFMFSGKEFGDAVFLTKAAAEEALERMNTKNR